MTLNSTDICFLILFILLLITSMLLNRISSVLEKKFNNDITGDYLESKTQIKIYRNLSFFFTVFVLLFYVTYYFTIKYQVEAHVLEWLQLVVRWAHVVLGIAWVGASFYFIFLENSLNRTENLRDEIAGNLWAIHGGGFYYVEKYKTAPTTLPKHLHWFKYEAYFTWLTGMILLTMVYFMNAKAMMIDTTVLDIKPLTAILIGIGTMVIGWFIYDIMCRTSLLQKTKLFGALGFVIVVLISFSLSEILSGRAAFMLVGALLGTIMAGNVFFCIIPSQKALVAATKANKPVNPELGKIAGLRSLHNNYIVLPVIFIMISNHFPNTFGNNFNWLILSGLIVASVAVRHYHNLYEKGKNTFWLLPFAAVSLIALVIVTAPAPKKSAKDLPPVMFSDVQTIIQKRCMSCHSIHPTDDVLKIAPNGIMYDSPMLIQKHAARIYFRTVQMKTMPLENKTGMTEEERELMRIWIEQGASTN